MPDDLKTGIGASVKRKEDFRFITGQGRYTDDINRPDQVYAYMLRSNVARGSLKINGKNISKKIEPNTLLSTFIREDLSLTGTHIGCDTSQCGACSVHLDGKAVKSCTILAIQAEGSEVTTIEGISDGDKLHPMQEAFRNNHGLQCGYCTPGMIMSAIKLVEDNPKISEKEIRKGLEGNICRCTGYNNIVKSISEASVLMGGK